MNEEKVGRRADPFSFGNVQNSTKLGNTPEAVTGSLV